MASTLVLLLQTDTPLHEARRQLGLRYGHLSIDRPAYLDRFLDYYEEWLGTRGRKHSAAALREWVTTDAFPGECRATFESLEAPRKLAIGEVPRFRVRVRNIGLTPWHFKPANTAGYHVVFLVKDADERWLDSGRAGLLDADVGARAEYRCDAGDAGLQRAGHYRLMVDMLDEQQCWFYQVGTEPMEMELDVHEQSTISQPQEAGTTTGGPAATSDRPATDDASKRKVGKYLRAAVSIGVLSWLAWRMDWAKLADAFAHLRLELWAAGGGPLSGHASGERLALAASGADRSGLADRYGNSRAFTLSACFSTCCCRRPSAGDVVRAWYLDNRRGRRLPAMLSVLVDRASGLMLLILIACGAVLFAPVAAPRWTAWCVWGTAACAFAGVAMLPIVARCRHRALRASRID